MNSQKSVTPIRIIGDPETLRGLDLEPIESIKQEIGMKVKLKRDWTMPDGTTLTKGLQATVVESPGIHELDADVLIHVNISGVIFPFVVPDSLIEDDE